MSQYGGKEAQPVILDVTPKRQDAAFSRQLVRKHVRAYSPACRAGSVAPRSFLARRARLPLRT